ncbi:hypothetical protein CH373_00455 [Leptospira perolatii]|uniref:Tetratricopeptide repeat protein n=1 Tax=Leptospira perolatii TaxID=2023191 RepID=A0A2M9ZR64_9LEPT|nr:hypothetical protein [Leptospira perolatii]PJZ71038.1 hypothetical protein CH360_00455 [Leptospira perolatii]PJZ74570.1 hypothetical protein CH373_00455 [Leptospira perolatii]
MLKRTWKKIQTKKHPNFLLISIFTGTTFLLVQSCVYPIKHGELLEKDPFFLYAVSDRYPKEFVNSNDNPWKAKLLRNTATSWEEHNNLGVLFARNSLLDDSEIEFEKSLELAPNQPEPLLNLVRLYFLTEEYEDAKAAFTKHLQKMGTLQREKIEKTLESSNREEELVLFWDSLSKIPGQELNAWEKLAEYFFAKQDWSKSYYYLEKILQFSPYNKNARGMMVRMAYHLEKWDEVLVFGSSLVGTKERIADLEFYLAQAYYEKQRYTECIQWIGKIPEQEKESLAALHLWKSCLLSKNPKSDLRPLLSYFRKLRVKGLQISEEDFFPTLTPEGKEALERLLIGR